MQCRLSLESVKLTKGINSFLKEQHCRSAIFRTRLYKCIKKKYMYIFIYDVILVGTVA